ncbi:hypothetical protein D3C80_1071960 [compost metagenome]
MNRRHVAAEPDPGGAQFVLEEVQLHQLAQSVREERVLVEVDLADDGALWLHRAAEEQVDGIGLEPRVPDGPQLGNDGAQDRRDQHVERCLLHLLSFLQDRQACAFQRLDALGLAALPQANEHDLLTAEADERAVNLAKVGAEEPEVLQPRAHQFQRRLLQVGHHLAEEDDPEPNGRHRMEDCRIDDRPRLG